jgi:hypothetical protein
MSHKIAKLALWVIPIICLSLCPAASLAQADSPEKQEKTAAKPAHTHTVTGCLAKGDEPGEFSITGEDGKTWGLRSATVKLDPHVGHKVTVTGSKARESKTAEKAEEKTEKEKTEGQMEKAAGKEEYADLNVTHLKMISDSCTK